MILTSLEAAYVFSAIAVRYSAITMPAAILKVSLIIVKESVMCSLLAVMLEQWLTNLFSMAMGDTVIEVSRVRGRAIVVSNDSTASHTVFHPLPLISLETSHKFTDAVPLAEFEVSFIRGSITIFHSAMAMPQAILKLTNVDNFLFHVDRFTEAVPDSGFPFALVSYLAVCTLSR